MKIDQSDFNSASVRNYYESNTRRFLRFGGSANAGAIHRKLWGEGVRSEHEALLHVNHLLAEWLSLEHDPKESPKRILDIGCGVGGTALWLASKFNVDVTAITISPRQINEARERASSMKLRGTCTFHEADFHTTTLGNTWDAAYAIEAFTHASSPEQFLSNTARHIRPGGCLFLVDDFLTDTKLGNLREAQDRKEWVQRFQHGWHLSSLVTLTSVEDAAMKTGFHIIRSLNLTPMIHFPGRITSAILRILSRLPGKDTYWSSLRGGIALQLCLSRGWVEYRMLELHRNGG